MSVTPNFDAAILARRLARVTGAPITGSDIAAALGSTARTRAAQREIASRWARRERSPSPAAEALASYLAQGADALDLLLPEWLVATPLGDRDDSRALLIHLYWPRFVAIEEPSDAPLRADEMTAEVDPTCRLSVVQWVDDPWLLPSRLTPEEWVVAGAEVYREGTERLA